MHGASLHGAVMPLFATLAVLCAVSVADGDVCSTAGDVSSSPKCTQPAQAGIALIQQRRTITAVESGDGEVAAWASVEDAAAFANPSPAHGAPCIGSGCGHDSKANKTEALIAVASSRKVSANKTGPSWRENPSSYSLSAAGQGDGLSSSVSSLVGEPETHNESMPPIVAEHIEPFGYPGAGLLLELHLPKVTLRELHTSARGSLAQFLLEVRGELGKGAQVHESRLSILGIHGRYKRYDSDGYFRMHSDRTDHMAGSQHLEEEVVVRFEILPGWSQDVDPRSALNVLRDQLNSSDSGLLSGPLGTILLNSTVTLSTPVEMASQSRMIQHRGLSHMSAMAWPIGISAAFIGVLIWLAAY